MGLEIMSYIPLSKLFAPKEQSTFEKLSDFIFPPKQYTFSERVYAVGESIVNGTIEFSNKFSSMDLKAFLCSAQTHLKKVDNPYAMGATSAVTSLAGVILIRKGYNKSGAIFLAAGLASAGYTGSLMAKA